MNYKKYLYFVLAFFAISCKQYHDTTARYNPYFLAKERMLEVENKLFGNPKDDYNNILGVLPPLDTVASKSHKEDYEYIIKKANFPIQWHADSKWVDYCYLVIGKARMYAPDLPLAIATFKFINTNAKSPNARHAALIMLIRAYTFLEEYNNAEYTANYIKRDPDVISRKNKIDYYLAVAQFYLQNKQPEKTALYLEKALDEMRGKKNKARLYYILGQIYLEQDKRILASENFKKVLKNTPTFDLEFNARLLQKSAGKASSPDDFAKSVRYFERMEKDPKYKDKVDKILYEKANFYYAHDSVPSAINTYKEALAYDFDSKNPVQKAYSYYRLGQIHYKIKSYPKAALYYDSTVKMMPVSMRDGEQIKNMAAILKEFAQYYVALTQEDEKQRMAKMPVEEAEAIFLKQIAEEKDRIEREFKDRKKKEAQRQYDKDQEDIKKNALAQGISGQGDGQASAWPFYDEGQLKKEFAKFSKTWKNVGNVDNWRRGKVAEKLMDNDTSSQNTAKSKSKVDPELQALLDAVDDLPSRMARLPTTPEKIEKSNKRIQKALFMLGKIYIFRLDECKDALDMFDRLVRDFPENEDCPEALYIAYQTAEKKGCADPAHYKDLLVSKYPNSLFGKLILDKDYLKKQELADKKAEGLYQKAYQFYLAGDYANCRASTKEIAEQHPESSLGDKVRLLNANATYKMTEDAEKYRTMLTSIISDYPESEVAQMASNLIEALNRLQK